MRACVLVSGLPVTPDAVRLKTLLRRRATRSAWSWVEIGPDLSLARSASADLPLHQSPDGTMTVVGDLFRAEPAADAGTAAGGATAWPPAGASTPVAFGWLASQTWGRYLAVHQSAPGRLAVFRDPSGTLDCLTWAVSGLRLFASEAADWLDPALPSDLSIDDDAVAGLLAAPDTISARCVLAGLQSVAPGQAWEGEGLSTLWSPASVVRRGWFSREEGLRDLRPVVSRCVTQMIDGRGPLLCEISGGLDSAIVADAVSRAGGQTAEWLNFFTTEVEGDERAYARAVADRLQVPLAEYGKPAARLAKAGLKDLQTGFRPSLAGLDEGYDRLITARALATGAGALVTGHGGDTVFFQPLTDLIAIDHLRAAGLRALSDGMLPALARSRRESVWKLASKALKFGAAAHLDDIQAPSPFLHAARIRTPPAAAHPWLTEIDDLPPAKRLQIYALALNLRRLGASRRSSVLDVIDPLLAQPVVELCLRLRTPDLTLGGMDRGLARQAFADDLPDVIRRRRSKGSGGAYFGRMVEAALPMLRAQLLEGELARRGIIDRARLEPMLDPAWLIAQGGYLELLDALAVELWLRAWVERIARVRSVAPQPLA